MKKAVLMSFVILLLSAAVVFAQTDQQVVSSNEEDVSLQQPQKAQKVSEIRKVVIRQDLQKAQAKKTVRYDEKGGIIVPNASKGIEIKPIAPRQNELLNKVTSSKKRNMTGKASVKSSSPRAYQRDTSSTNRVQKAGQKQSGKSTKEKRKE